MRGLGVEGVKADFLSVEHLGVDIERHLPCSNPPGSGTIVNKNGIFNGFKGNDRACGGRGVLRNSRELGTIETSQAQFRLACPAHHLELEMTPRRSHANRYANRDLFYMA